MNALLRCRGRAGRWGVGLLAALAAHTAAGQSVPAQHNYVLPEVPALTLISATPAKVVRPVTPRALASEILNGVDSTGRVQQGIAVAVTPWSLIPKLAINLKDYQTVYWKYLLANTQLSVGSTRAAGVVPATDLAVGLRLNVLDRSDPMRSADFTTQLRGKLVLPEQPTPAAVAAAAAASRQAAADFRQQWLKTNWNQAALAVAGAYGWRLTEARLDSGGRTAPERRLGWSTWATGALPLGGQAGQLLGQVRYARQRLASRQTNHQWIYGARALFGAPTVGFYAEVTGTSNSVASAETSKSRADWGVGLEFRAAEGLWISTGLGRKFDGAGPAEGAVLLANLRWEIASGPRFIPTPP